MRWLTTTNHKDIGTMYLVFSLVMFFVGGAMALVIRAELFQPGMQFVDPDFFNKMTTVHALIMVFGAVMPAFVGLANWMIPLMIGAPDMALPRMNNFSFWLLVAAFSLLILSLFMPGGGPAGRLDALPAAGAADRRRLPVRDLRDPPARASRRSWASINIIVTIMNMRAPGMTLLKMPLFVWTWLITAYLLIAVMPVLAGAVTMLLTDHFFGTSFFAGGGRRRPGAVPAHLLVLRPPRGLHHDPAGLRHRVGDHPDLLAQAAVRLRLDGVRDGLDRASCRSSSGRTTCSRSACRSPARCSSC